MKTDANLKVGDYVLACKYSDGDPKDHFCIGFYSGSYDHFGSTRYIVKDEDGKPFRSNGFRAVKRISHARGLFLVSNIKTIEKSNHNVWHWLRVHLS